MPEYGKVPSEAGLIHLLERLTDYVRESEPFALIKQTDGEVVARVEEKDIKTLLTFFRLKLQIFTEDNHDEKCIKENQFVLEQLSQPRFCFALPVGGATHFVPIDQKEDLLKEIAEFIEWKRNKTQSSN